METSRVIKVLAAFLERMPTCRGIRVGFLHTALLVTDEVSSEDANRERRVSNTVGASAAGAVTPRGAACDAVLVETFDP